MSGNVWWIFYFFESLFLLLRSLPACYFKIVKHLKHRQNPTMEQKPVWGAIQLTRLQRQRRVTDSTLMMIKCYMIVVACVAAPVATGLHRSLREV